MFGAYNREAAYGAAGLGYLAVEYGAEATSQAVAGAKYCSRGC